MLHETRVSGTVLWSPTNANSPTYTLIRKKRVSGNCISGGPPVLQGLYRHQRKHLLVSLFTRKKPHKVAEGGKVGGKNLGKTIDTFSCSYREFLSLQQA